MSSTTCRTRRRSRCRRRARAGRSSSPTTPSRSCTTTLTCAPTRYRYYLRVLLRVARGGGVSVGAGQNPLWCISKCTISIDRGTYEHSAVQLMRECALTGARARAYPSMHAYPLAAFESKSVSIHDINVIYRNHDGYLFGHKTMHEDDYRME